MKANTVLLIAVAAVLLLLAARFFLPYELPDSQSIKPPAIPQGSRGKDKEWIETLLANNLWDKDRGQLELGDNADTQGAIGKEQLGLSGGDGETAWQLVGVSHNGQQQLAVIKSGSEVKSLKPGDQLPNGAEVVKVLPYGIQTTRLGKNENFYLFGKK